METLTVCDLVDVTPLTPTLHSRLYHLEPIGVGTRYVESLTSYLTRLAQAHALRVRDVALHEIAPLLDQHYAPEFVHMMFSRESHGLNGISSWSAIAIWALEKLTERHELSFLTMQVFGTVLAAGGLMRSVQAWCPQCYHGWRQTGQPIYQPLLWALQVNIICPVHRQPLQVQCPACQTTVPFLTSQSAVGYCPRCQGWLGSSTPTPSGATLSKTELEQVLWKVQTTGELLAVAPYLTVPLSKERVAQAMAAYVESTPTESALGLTTRANLPQGCLRPYLKKTPTVRLDRWLDLCWRLELSPFHLLIDPETIKPNIQNNIDWGQEMRAKFNEPSRSLERGEVQQILITLSTSDEIPPPSLKEVARRVKQSTDALRQHFPDLCRMIVKRYQTYQQASKLHTQRELEAILNTPKDPPPTLDEVAQQLGQPTPLLRCHFPELCCAIAERCRAYHDIEKQQLRGAVEAIVNADENPPPSVSEIAQRLKKPSSVLYNQYPDLCRILTDRQHAYTEAQKQRIRHELEAILADENPPPTIMAVAQRLDQSVGYLCHTFPAVCRAITERRRTYDQAEKLRIQLKLKAVLIAGEVPPPTVIEVAQRLGQSDHFLREHFPEQCAAVVEQRQAYQESEKVKLRQALEAILVNNAGAPLSLREVAQQLEQPTRRLRYLFPDLCQAITAQPSHPTLPGVGQASGGEQPQAIDKLPQPGRDDRTQHWRQQLETILASDEEPPPSLQEVTRRLECSRSILCNHFPDLCQAILQRRQTYQEAKRLHTQRELEAILASDEMPPPALCEVARRLGNYQVTLRSSVTT